MDGQNEDMPRGYTDESVRMLRSKEGQLNAVFACFGSTVQHAQMFEQGLTRFLMMYNKVSADSVSVDDIGKKMTMGQLLYKIGQHVTVNDYSVEERFSTGLADRNYLIHRFFLEQDLQFASTKGRMQLLSELVKIETNLEHCCVTINAMRIAMCRTIGIEDDWAQDYS